MGRASNGAPARRGRWPTLRCSWDDIACVSSSLDIQSCDRNRDTIVQCLDLATDEDELTLLRLGLDWGGGWLWRVDRALVWVDEDGSDHWLPYAPDARLRRISGDDPGKRVEAATA